MTLAPVAASLTSFVTSILAPDFFAISLACSTIKLFGAHLPVGVATTTWAPESLIVEQASEIAKKIRG